MIKKRKTSGNSSCPMVKNRAGWHLRGELRLYEPMSRHTSWRVGGLADRFYISTDLDDLSQFLSIQDSEETYTWIGLGSNMLVRDGGISGTIIATLSALEKLKILGKQLIKVGAGTTCMKLARFVANSNLSGTEFLAGIPGTVGGALAMNAGAFDTEIWELVRKVQTINSRGKQNSYTRDEFEVTYRSVVLPDNEWFISADIELRHDVEGKPHELVRELLARRAQMQPIGKASCGSVFRNPESDYAARLIDESGLKGARIGGAHVSDKHANFIINDGNASASDIEQLIYYIQETVQKKCSVLLEPEVRIIGKK